MDIDYFYKKYKDAVFLQLLRYSRDREVAEDLMQETFIRIQQSFHTYDPGKGSFLTWARAVSKNVFIRYHQKKGELTLFDSETVSQEPDNRKSTEDLIEQKISIEVINDAMECLTEPERSIVYYKYKLGLTLDEIAKKLNLSRRTISRRYLKALELLQIKLKDYKPE